MPQNKSTPTLRHSKLGLATTKAKDEAKRMPKQIQSGTSGLQTPSDKANITPYSKAKLGPPDLPSNHNQTPVSR